MFRDLVVQKKKPKTKELLLTIPRKILVIAAAFPVILSFSQIGHIPIAMNRDSFIALFYDVIMQKTGPRPWLGQSYHKNNSPFHPEVGISLTLT